MAFSHSKSRKQRVVFGLVVGGACAAALSPIGCSSDSTAKKAPTKFTPDGGGDGGGAGETASAGTAGSAGGTGRAGTGNTGGDAGGHAGGSGGGTVVGVGGTAGASVGGEAGAAGAAGVSGAPIVCLPGYADCDNNPADCETPLTLTTSCGACGTSCDGSHATVACTGAKCVVSACAANYGDCDKDGVTGCETAIDTDTHCGDCTRNCQAVGSTCSSGKCGAISVSTTYGNGYQTALASGALYVMNTGSMPPGSYTIARIPLNGAAITQLVDYQPGGPGAGVLNADASFIYWAVQGSPGSVLKKAITAASTDLNTVVFQPVGTLSYLKIVGAAYYWMTSAPTSTLYTRPTTAAQSNIGTQIMSVDQGYVSAFTPSSDRIYWVHRPASVAALTYVPLAGGAPTNVPDAVVADNAPLYAVGNTLYFVRSGPTNVLNGIYKFTTGDTTVTQLVQSDVVSNLVADANGVYYSLSADDTIYKAPLTGGVGTGIATGFSRLFAGQDATFIYSYQGWGGALGAGAILKFLK